MTGNQYHKKLLMRMAFSSCMRNARFEDATCQMVADIEDGNPHWRGWSIATPEGGKRYVHDWAADSLHARLRPKAKLHRANQEIALLREETWIKNSRMKHL